MVQRTLHNLSGLRWSVKSSGKLGSLKWVWVLYRARKKCPSQGRKDRLEEEKMMAKHRGGSTSTESFGDDSEEE